MTLLLLHGGWDTLVLAFLYWTWPFIMLGILTAWIVRKRRRSRKFLNQNAHEEDPEAHWFAYTIEFQCPEGHASTEKTVIKSMMQDSPLTNAAAEDQKRFCQVCKREAPADARFSVHLQFGTFEELKNAGFPIKR